MTRQTVRNAYSGVKPSQEQKDKMWNAIMAQKDTRPVEVSRIKPSGGFRFSNLAAPLGLAAVLALVVWFGGSAMLRGNHYSATAADQAAETNAVSEEQTLRAESTVESLADAAESTALGGMDALYRTVLEKYVTAIRENKDPGQCSEHQSAHRLCGGSGRSRLVLSGSGWQWRGGADRFRWKCDL